MDGQYVPFAERPGWSDVQPIAQDDGDGEPVVAIAYSREFVDAMNYFRAIVRADERSARALELTAEVIAINAANYTAWYYRRLCLAALTVDSEQRPQRSHPLWTAEFDFIQAILDESPKNYQIWFHRQQVVEATQDHSRELADIATVLAGDAKNYHAWTHRQWVLRTFRQWSGEIAFIEQLLDDDLRNNSAWNHRWFVVHHKQLDQESKEADVDAGSGGGAAAGAAGGATDRVVAADKLPLKPAILQAEIDFTFSALAKIPRNESAWVYLRGLLDHQPETADDEAVLADVLARVEALRRGGGGDQAPAPPVPADASAAAAAGAEGAEPLPTAAATPPRHQRREAGSAGRSSPRPAAALRPGRPIATRRPYPPSH